MSLNNYFSVSDKNTGLLEISKYILLGIMVVILTSAASLGGTKIKNRKKKEPTSSESFYSMYYFPDEYEYPDQQDMVNGSEFLELKDPLEKFNRKMLVVNGFLDYVAVQPLARIYNRVVPQAGREAITNSLDNIKAPQTMTNSLLQGKPRNAMASFWGFILNTTLGLGGAFDFMGEYGFKAQDQDFGKTLAYYGARPGPYLVLPVFGPTTARDSTRFWFPFDSYSNKLTKQYLPSYAKSSVMPLSIINGRAKSLEFSEKMMKNSTDIYVTIRSAYFQNREANVEYPKRILKQHGDYEYKQDSQK
jgi:phospholipid-binding lipoprotein MlaA